MKSLKFNFLKFSDGSDATNAIAIIILSFSFHTYTFSFYECLENRNFNSFMIANSIGVLVSSIFYILVGSIIYLSFGDYQIKQYSTTDILNRNTVGFLINLAYIISVIMTFPISFFALKNYFYYIIPYFIKWFGQIKEGISEENKKCQQKKLEKIKKKSLNLKKKNSIVNKLNFLKCSNEIPEIIEEEDEECNNEKNLCNIVASKSTVDINLKVNDDKYIDNKVSDTYNNIKVNIKEDAIIETNDEIINTYPDEDEGEDNEINDKISTEERNFLNIFNKNFKIEEKSIESSTNSRTKNSSNPTSDVYSNQKEELDEENEGDHHEEHSHHNDHPPELGSFGKLIVTLCLLTIIISICTFYKNMKYVSLLILL